jgi:hypothetical protein
MKSEVLGIEVDVKIRHIGLINKEFRLRDEWDVVIENNRIQYHTGIAHRKFVPSLGNRITIKDCKRIFNKKPLKTKDNYQVYIKEIESVSKPVTPKLDDILYCLVMDSSALDMPFNDWCSEFGYNTDSIKANDIYRVCQENGFIMKKIYPSIEEAREKFQDY